MMSCDPITTALGRGIFAGAIGTAVMTVSSTIEMKLRNRGSSSTPAQAVEKVLGIKPTREQEQARFSNMVHWAYGTAWGIPRGLLAAAGLGWTAATAAHLLAVWGAEVVMLPSIGVISPVYQWGTKEIAIDVFHHLVYATATGLAYASLSSLAQQPAERLSGFEAVK